MPLESLGILGESTYRSIYFSMTYKNSEKKKNKKRKKERKACNIFPCQHNNIPCVILKLEWCILYWQCRPEGLGRNIQDLVLDAKV